MRQALEDTEFHIAPVLNPDGYEHTHTIDRLWRKNKAKNIDGTVGVDLNRNWPNHWGTVLAALDPFRLKKTVDCERVPDSCGGYVCVSHGGAVAG